MVGFPRQAAGFLEAPFPFPVHPTPQLVRVIVRSCTPDTLSIFFEDFCKRGLLPLIHCADRRLDIDGWETAFRELNIGSPNLERGLDSET
jgi:hypothetical protein